MDHLLSSDPHSFDPNNLLDLLKAHLGLRTDSALAEALDMLSQQVSRIRRRNLPLSASALIKMHEVSGLSILELKSALGDRREKQRVRKGRALAHSGCAK